MKIPERVARRVAEHVDPADENGCIVSRYSRGSHGYAQVGWRDWPLGQCANGHPDEELRTQPSGKQVCRLCSTDWQRNYRARRTA